MTRSRKARLGDAGKPPNALLYKKFLNMAQFATTLSVILLFFYPSYFPVIIAEKMIFSGADGNCISETVHFGRHCFGDYGSLILLMDQVPDPWESYNPLIVVTPLVLIISKFFIFLNTLPSPGIVLGLYIVILIICVTFPVLRATQGFRIAERFKTVTYLTLMTLPVFAVIDRGNNAVWSIPFVYLGITSGFEKKYNKAAIYMALAIAIRPQLVILLILFLATKNFRVILNTLMASFLIYFLSFSMYLQKLSLQPFFNYADGLRQYGGGIPGTWPPNLSLARGMKIALGWIGLFPEDGTIITISYVFIVCIITLIIVEQKKNGMIVSALLLIPLIFLIAPMTWAYYGAFLQVSFALIIKYKIASSNIQYSDFFCKLFILAIFATSTLLYVPLLNDYNNLVQFCVPIMWLTFYSYFLLAVVNENIHKLRK
jgi:hypothetical protein